MIDKNDHVRNKITGKEYKVLDSFGLRDDKFILARIKKSKGEPVTEVVRKADIEKEYELVED